MNQLTSVCSEELILCNQITIVNVYQCFPSVFSFRFSNSPFVSLIASSISFGFLFLTALYIFIRYYFLFSFIFFKKSSISSLVTDSLSLYERFKDSSLIVLIYSSKASVVAVMVEYEVIIRTT